LQCCGIGPAAILPDADGVPRWPPGFVGSISHCDGLCAAAAGPRAVFEGIGIDVERITRLDAGAGSLICGFRELERLGSLSQSHGGLGETLIFSAKESIYKCLFPLIRAFIEFHEIEVTVELEAGRFAAKCVSPGAQFAALVPKLSGHFSVSAPYVVTGAILRAQPQAAAG
jgi:4'-phosphopantetheinyl transferase EntD